MLKKIRLEELVRKQTLFKLKALSSAVLVLIIVQTVFLVISVLASSGGSMGSNYYEIDIQHVSGDIVIGFTMIWAFIVGALITSKAYRYDDFSFVTSRLSAHLANIGYMVIVSSLGGLTAFLSGFTIKLFTFFVYEGEILKLSDTSAAVMFSGLVATILYMVLFMTLGYVCGMLVQMYEPLKIIIPALVFGAIIFLSEFGVLLLLVEQFLQEPSILLFALKVIGTCGVLLVIIIWSTDKLEVRV
ncbi:hypothetical protein [Alkalihalobacillus pseudalcaliphilus]|uniref:hypothetical protein n=1 Tax=Alkalihalobacillus pseudalcaliphilus TaxID=79884 RepID=UPI00064D75AE|nr:hypothetical protein [Alkalihalobacillus pseudalcaliphilus]KMK75535.1 hypothetical protein AB990_09560 [Alkalihalobacillus pseudalcaliphilus]